jgi:hypothetical protein
MVDILKEIRFFASVVLRDMSFFGSFVFVLATFMLMLILTEDAQRMI